MSLMQMSFYGAVMIVAILVIRFPSINRLPKGVFVLLWKLALLRLLIPFSIPSVLSAYSLVRSNAPARDALAQTPVDNVISQAPALQINMNTDTTSVIQTVQHEATTVSVWFALWIIGAILCVVFFAVSYLRCYLEFRESLPVDNRFIAEWITEHRIKRTIQIRQLDRISAPLTYGILKPVILMPGKTDWEDMQQLQYVLWHEYIHILRFDMVWKLIAALALCIHWFNPLVWVMYKFFNRDIELSCDERVVRQFGETSKSTYARTLISMEEKKSGLTPLCNNFSKTAIEERITAIMKTKKLTLFAIIISVVILVGIVVLFATSAKGEPASSSGNIDMTAEETTSEEQSDRDTEGPDLILIEAPAVVLDAASQYVEGDYINLRNQGYGYSDWRIESLEHVYTYADFEEMTLQVYQMNYEFLADDPEKVQLVGGMTMDEEGWVVPGYPYSTYLIFRQKGQELSYLTSLFENDCFPGDETFTSDLTYALENLSARNENMDTMMISYSLEEDEEMPASRYVGDGFYIYIPDMGWNVYKPWDRPVEMEAVYDSEIKIWVEHYPNASFLEVEERLLSEGYAYDDNVVKLRKFDGSFLLEARIVAQDNDVWVVSSSFNAAYDWGSRVDAIAATFTIIKNVDETSLESGQADIAQQSEDIRELEEIMTAFCEAYFAGDEDTIRQYLVKSLRDQKVTIFDVGEPEIRGIKGNSIMDDKCQLYLEFRASGEDSLTYLDVNFIKEDGDWKVSWYGLEK